MRHKPDSTTYLGSGATPEAIQTCLSCPREFCSGNCARVSGSPGPGKRPWVRCIETGEVYLSASEAARCNGRHAATIRGHLEGRYAHCGGLHFEYIRSKEELTHA